MGYRPDLALQEELPPHQNVHGPVGQLSTTVSLSEPARHPDPVLRTKRPHSFYGKNMLDIKGILTAEVSRSNFKRRHTAEKEKETAAHPDVYLLLMILMRP